MRAGGSESTDVVPQASQPPPVGVVFAADHATAGPPSPSRSTASSDPGCSCCTWESGHQQLARKRSNGTSPLRKELQCRAGEAVEECQPPRAAAWLQQRVLGTMLTVLVCSLLVAALLPLHSQQSSLAWGRLARNVLPQGPFVWELKWRLLGGPDPRPLYDVRMLGEAAVWPTGSAVEFASMLTGASRIAVVGNGPLTDAQRVEIEAADRVVRFNAMNNRRSEERVDIWAVRFNRIPPHQFWGFQQLEDGEVQAVLAQASGVLFLGGAPPGRPPAESRAAVDKVRFWFPSLRPGQAQQISVDAYWRAYNALFTRNGSTSLLATDTMPSSGLLGLLAVLAAVEPETAVDLYGFNWSLQSYELHQMSQEELIIRRLVQRHPRVSIHPTACAGFYSCEPVCDTGQFRLAVDEQHCAVQVRKARRGEPAAFVDHHTIHNLDWYPAAKKQALARLGLKHSPPAGRSQLEAEAWLRRVAAALRNDTEAAPAPAPSAEDLAATWQDQAALRFRRKLQPGVHVRRAALNAPR